MIDEMPAPRVFPTRRELREAREREERARELSREQAANHPAPETVLRRELHFAPVGGGADGARMSASLHAGPPTRARDVATTRSAATRPAPAPLPSPGPSRSRSHRADAPTRTFGRDVDVPRLAGAWARRTFPTPAVPPVPPPPSGLHRTSPEPAVTTTSAPVPMIDTPSGPVPVVDRTSTAAAALRAWAPVVESTVATRVTLPVHDGPSVPPPPPGATPSTPPPPPARADAAPAETPVDLAPVELPTDTHTAEAHPALFRESRHRQRTRERTHLTSRPVRWGAQAMVLAAVVGTTGAFTVYHRHLDLDVDGSTRAVDAYGWTVGDVLAQQHVSVKEGDVVEPALSAPARGVDEIVVRTSRQVTIEDDGELKTITTTASTVGELMDALGSRADGAITSASRSAPLGREPLRISTTKSLHVLVDGQDVPVTTSASTVGQVLTDAGVELGSKDTTSAPVGAAAVDGMVVVVNRGKSSKSHVTQVIAFDSKEIKDPSLPKGQKVVKTTGRVGSIERTYTVSTKGGVEVSRTLVSQEVTAEPVDEVVLVGTMAVPDPSTVVVSPGSAQAIAKAMVADRGWDSSQFSCLVSLWNRESGWRVTASNGSSGAYGIPQALPGSKMATVGSDWRTNAKTQITWGLNYIAGRYGTPCGAWGHSQATGWY
ncbi:ubiquitin-like domain-containing protein [Luteimicrobium sp. NPDC057192]|uniref:aggregation-promoting factor C-terminal-like domain-containing protein n=1 Tax=Luteimicrobium sp. NPDC057192 TaxID=3346042 RepID=UPI00362A9715